MQKVKKINLTDGDQISGVTEPDNQSKLIVSKQARRSDKEQKEPPIQEREPDYYAAVRGD